MGEPINFIFPFFKSKIPFSGSKILPSISAYIAFKLKKVYKFVAIGHNTCLGDILTLMIFSCPKRSGLDYYGWNLSKTSSLAGPWGEPENDYWPKG